MDYSNIFEKYLYEDTNEDPPDSNMSTSGSDPPDMPDDAGTDDGPPDMDDDIGGDDFSDSGDDGPPEMDDGMGDFGSEEDEFSDEDSNEDENENLQLNEKISAIMNKSLYGRFLTLLNTIGEQLSSIKKNSDVLYSISPESIDIIDSLTRLDENIRLYLDNTFLNEDYSVNLLFFNKCLNLLKLLNIDFDKHIRKGMKNIE